MQGDSRLRFLAISSGDDVTDSEVTNNVLRVVKHNLAVHNLSGHTGVAEAVGGRTSTITKLQSRSVNRAALNLSSSQRVKSMRLLAIHQNGLLSRSNSQVRLLSPGESRGGRSLSGRLTAIVNVVVHGNGATEALLGDSGSNTLIINGDGRLTRNHNLLAVLRDSCPISG